jgi:homoserine kinase type II
MSGPDVADLLRSWEISPVTVAPLLDGEKNRNWLVISTTGLHVVARSYTSSTFPEVEYELHATEFLAQSGFHTPAPLRTEDGSLWDVTDGHPAAIFEYVVGQHPPEMRDGFWSSDFSLGCEAAGLAGQLHALSWRRSFPGRRTNQRDPLHQIAQFLSGPYAQLAVLREAVGELAAQYEKMVDVCANSAGLPQGLVHNDISAHNLLVDSSGAIAGLIDFDDCITSFLLYDLGRIAETWGHDINRRADVGRIQQIIAAYDAVRPLTERESNLAIDFIATYAAATGVSVLTNKLRQGTQLQDPRESYSMLLFLDLRADAHL